jgi:hypothetical protein
VDFFPKGQALQQLQARFFPTKYRLWQAQNDLTWLFWTKLCEKLSLERSFGYAEEEVQR